MKLSSELFTTKLRQDILSIINVFLASFTLPGLSSEQVKEEIRNKTCPNPSTAVKETYFISFEDTRKNCYELLFMDEDMAETMGRPPNTS